MADVLSKIYTRAGDDGRTALGDGNRVAKTNPRLDACSAVEKVNAALGLVVALGSPERRIVEDLQRLQHDMFVVVADLSTPVVEGQERLRVDKSYVARLEDKIDIVNDELTPTGSFVVPGGTPAAALLFSARITVRDAERGAWALVEAAPQETNLWPAKYLNRAADLLLVLARLANVGFGDVTWSPDAHP